MAPQAAPATPATSTPTPAGFELYDPDTDPKVVTQPAPVTTPVPEAAAVPAAPKHSATMVVRAKQLGLNETDVAGMSPAELKDWVTESAVSRILDRPDMAPAAPAAAAAPVAEPQKTGADLLAELKKISDPDLADAINSFIDARLKGLDAARIDKLEAAVGHALKFVQSKSAEEADNQIDQGFEDLGPSYERFFGKGNARTLGREDPNFERRKALVQKLRSAPPKDGDIRKAVADLGRKMFGDLAGSTPAPKPGKNGQARDPVTQRFTAADYEEAALVLPNSHAAEPTPNGKAKAVAAVKRLQQDSAAEGGVNINEGEDEFL